MVARDCRPRHPPDGTVRADRRSRDPSGRHRPGRPKKLSGAELVCLAVAQVMLGARSGHHWIRLCYARLGHLFPCLPKQPGDHKRVRAAAPLICRAAMYLARRCPSWAGPAAAGRHPVPCGTSRETVRRSDLADLRQWVEAIFGTRKDQLSLERHGGRTTAGSTPASPSGCSPCCRYLAQLADPRPPASDL
jgi:hypothetical protein